MTNKKNTRRALFMSALSLILCFAMLMGTTFAWFTDSVASANNLIQAGNLDVELYHSDNSGIEAKVDGTTTLFDEVMPGLWEPGAVVYENLRVENVGTLALKYDLNLTVRNESVVNEHKLSEVIKVGVVNEKITSTDRDEVIAKVETWTPLSQFNLNMTGETLEARNENNENHKSKDFSVVLYWQPNSNEIDNLYNMNNGNQGKKLELDIGVELYATQVEKESDSFGIDYDAGAYIEDDAALKDALTENKETIIVNLTSDVTWDAAAWDNNAMGGELTKTIAINGNGHTITFNNTNSDWTNIVTGDAVLIIENATITNSGYDATSGTWNGHDITFKNEVKLNNVTLLNAIALMDNATLTNVNLTDDSSGDAYGIWIRPNGQTVSIDGLTMDMTTSDGNDRGIKIDNQYAEADDKGVTLTVKNASFKTEKKAAILVKSTGNVKIDLANVNISGVADDPINAVWVDEDVKDNADNIVVTGGTKIVEGELKAATPDTVQDMINAAAAGDEILLKAGTYETTIVMKSNITLVGAEGAVVHFINLNGAENVTLKGITFDAAGAQPAYYNSTIQAYTNIASRGQDGNTGAMNVTIDNCNFSGKFTNSGAVGSAPITFSDYDAKGGRSNNVIIKNCTFDTEGHTYNIYGYYVGNGGSFSVENNTFADTCKTGPIYIGRSSFGTHVLKDNHFENVKDLDSAIYIQDHAIKDKRIAPDASGNTFGA